MINKIKGFPRFLKEVGEELKKVNWSKREELIEAAVLVIIISAIFTTYISLIDLGLSKVIQLLLK